ncbi:mucin-5AC-like [Armigeres subalbatus]|uniref:mucin-5AC-like n=1 Tax=Armigeres subalbatus TaxID=124917 RepID=UPI002ECFE335
MSSKVRWAVWLGFVLSFYVVRTEGVSCSRIDFDQATLTYLSRCTFYQEFVSKPYRESLNFQHFREDANYYLSNQWEGLTCGETVDSFSLNQDTEFRMVYNLIFESGATLEVRILDLDRLDSESNPTVVIRWKTEQATSGWGLFREKMDKTVKRAKIQIEANMNHGSDLAIEYFTVFNYEVETNECNAIDEFAPTTTTTTTTSSTLPSSTSTTLEATTSTTYEITSTPEMSTAYSQRDETTTTSTQVPSSTEILTSTEVPTSTVITSSTEITTSIIQSTTSTETPTTTEYSTSTEIPTTTTTISTLYSTTSTIATTIPAPLPSSNEWVWIALAALFASLFCLATAVSAYIYAMNRHLLDISKKLKDRQLYGAQFGCDHSRQTTNKRVTLKQPIV